MVVEVNRRCVHHFRPANEGRVRAHLHIHRLSRFGEVVFDLNDHPVAGMDVQRGRLRAVRGGEAVERTAGSIGGHVVGEVNGERRALAIEVGRAGDGAARREAGTRSASSEGEDGWEEEREEEPAEKFHTA